MKHPALTSSSLLTFRLRCSFQKRVTPYRQNLWQISWPGTDAFRHQCPFTFLATISKIGRQTPSSGHNPAGTFVHLLSTLIDRFLHRMGQVAGIQQDDSYDRVPGLTAGLSPFTVGAPEILQAGLLKIHSPVASVFDLHEGNNWHRNFALGGVVDLTPEGDAGMLALPGPGPWPGQNHFCSPVNLVGKKILAGPFQARFARPWQGCLIHLPRTRKATQRVGAPGALLFPKLLR
jgi:hypothetical protein